jgi:hypothetical protein
VGHEVRDGGVDLVPDARQHRHRAVGDGARDVLAVEPHQVRAPAAAAHEQDAVRSPRREAAQRATHGARSVLALHARVAAKDREADAAVAQRAQDVGVGGGVQRGDQAQHQRYGRQDQRLVAAVRALGVQALQQLAPLAVEPAQRVVRVDVLDDERQLPALRPEVRLDAQAHDEAAGQLETAQPPAGPEQLAHGRGPELQLERRARTLAGLVVHEIEEDVAIRPRLHLHGLAHDPHRLRKAARQRVLHRRHHLRNRQRLRLRRPCRRLRRPPGQRRLLVLAHRGAIVAARRGPPRPARAAQAAC